MCFFSLDGSHFRASSCVITFFFFRMPGIVIKHTEDEVGTSLPRKDLINSLGTQS